MSSPLTNNVSGGEASHAVSFGQPYDVFLSFRGLDTRAGFTDYLYTRLTDTGIRVYRDDEELRVGEEIGPELIAGINHSTIAIPIFSKGYAASKWCLKELAHVEECRKSRGLKVMPIFYDVTPHEVRNQTGDFADAFASHKKFYDDETISDWRKALTEVGNLKGWDIQGDGKRQEGKLVKEVTNKVLRELKKAYLNVTNCLVGMDHHVEEILNKICTDMGGVGILGIYGMGGIGKTTLAKVIYNRLWSHFESFAFLADIRETSRSKGMEFLQNQLVSKLLNMEFSSFTNIDEGIAYISTKFSNKRVLILLDDVYENFHLQGLIGDRYWFGSGSRIIITTRNKSVLDFVEVDWPFEYECMDPPNSLQLFSKHAFRENKPVERYVEISNKIVKKTGGLPLALEVVGSLLYGKSMKYWLSMFKKLEKLPHKNVTDKLRISYEALDERQKHIFLDIACFFIGVDQQMAIYFWDDSEFYAEEALEVLQQMSLIKVQENNLLWMHDQLRDYGRDIVCQENIMDPGQRSRLWNLGEATKIFMTKKEKENIQGIRVGFNWKSYLHFTEELTIQLKKVRLFWVEWYEDINYPNGTLGSAPSNFLPEKSHIFSEVRWLSWPFFPHKYIKTSNFSLPNLTILNLSGSSFTIDWDGWNQIKMATNLKVLNLSGCLNLVKSPDFSSHPRLERLILERCGSLVEIDESICELKHLVHINLRYCRSPCKLPKELHCMGSLTELLIDCTGIVEIPHWCDMVKLEVFSARDCWSLNCISLNSWTSLKKLSLTNSRVALIPDSIGEFLSLSELNLRGCHSLKKLPESIGGLVSLIQLKIGSSGIEELPNSIGCLKNLKLLDMQRTPIRELPTTIRMARKLEEINASFCNDLIGLPRLPESLIKLKLPYKIMAMIPDLLYLIDLRELIVATGREGSLPSPYLSWSKKSALLQDLSPWWIGKLSKLENLQLAFPTVTTLHPNLSALSQLKVLTLTYCPRLQSIPKLPPNLTCLRVSNCYSLERIGDLSRLQKLSSLSIWDTSLVELEIPSSLELLDLMDCDNLVEIPGRLEFLNTLQIQHCHSLVKIPDVLNVKTLKYLFIYYCPTLCHEAIGHWGGPILTDNPPKSESERRFMSIMLKICGYSQPTRVRERGKQTEKIRK